MIKKLLISLFSIAFLLILPATAYIGYLYCHPEFNPDEFEHPIVKKAAIALHEPSLETKQSVGRLLEQRFSYLGCGGQMTAYESEDRQYVIKFFNPRHPLKNRSFQSFKKIKRLFSLAWLNSAYFKRDARLMRLFTRYQIAWQELADETGIIYVHLNPSTAIDHRLDCVGKNGKSYSIDIKNVPFVLQKKAVLVRPYIVKLLLQGDRDEAKKAIAELKNLFTIRAQKGFTDKNQHISKNYGFVDGRAIQIDVGRINKDEAIKAAPEKELDRIFSHILATFPDL